MQNLRVTPLYGGNKLFLNIHVLTQLCVTGGHCQPLKDMLHIIIAVIEAVVDVQHLAVLAFLVALVEDAQHLVQTALAILMSVRLTVQTAT